MKEKIRMVFGGGQVKRYHTRATITTQNNAEHSYGVASLIALLKPDCSKELLLHALWHDIWEVETGDMPAYVKTRYPVVKEVLTKIEDELENRLKIMPKITDEEKALLKMADCIETIMHCQREQKMGNSNLDEVISSCSIKICEVDMKFPCREAMDLWYQLLHGEN